MEPERNYDGIQFEKYRRIVDPKFNELHDELTECYYHYWKLGKSKSFYGYDKQKTIKESKILFDKLHGLIWHYYTLALNEEHQNISVIEQVPKYEKYLNIKNKEGVVVDTRTNIAQKEIDKLKLEGIEKTWA